MITNTDISKLKSALMPEFNKIHLNIEQLGDNIGQIKTRLDILEDNVTGEIAKLQDENLITSTYKSSIVNLENRVDTLESKVAN